MTILLFFVQKGINHLDTGQPEIIDLSPSALSPRGERAEVESKALPE
jgi:hypothetical protein